MSLTLASGCAVSPLPEDYPDALPLPGEIAERFCYPQSPVEAELTLVKQARRYNVLSGAFESGLPGDDDPSPITFEYYELPDVDNAPVVVVLTILNGKKDLVRPFAKYFAKHGYASIIVDTTQRKTLENDLLEPEKAIRQSVLRNRRMLDWIEAQPNLDGNRIAVFGASLGGFNAVYLSALDGRIAAVVPALAASDLPYVFAHSTEGRLKAAVERVKAEYELDAEDLEAFLRDSIDTAILDLAPHIDPSRVQMVLARFDNAVPTEKQRELRQALGNPEAITLPTGHLTAAVYIPYLRWKALKFFDRVLAEDPEGRTASLGDFRCPDKETSPTRAP